MVSPHIQTMIDELEPFGPEGRRTQRRALDKLIELDAIVEQEHLVRQWVDGREDQRLTDRDALTVALAAVDVRYNHDQGCYTAGLALW